MAVGDARERVEGTPAGQPAPERERAAAARSGIAGTVLGLQHSAGNRAAAAWVRRLSRKPAGTPADPFDAAVKAAKWVDAADVLSELPTAEIEARIKKLKPKQRESLVQGARAVEPWSTPVLDVMETVDLHSKAVGSLRWARATGSTAMAEIWFGVLAPDDARAVAHDLQFTHAQLASIVGTSRKLQTMFKDLWAYTSKDERMLYVMDLLVFGYRGRGAAPVAVDEPALDQLGVTLRPVPLLSASSEPVVRHDPARVADAVLAVAEGERAVVPSVSARGR